MSDVENELHWVPIASKRSALEWAEWVAHEIKPGMAAALLAYRLASYWNERTGDAWPSLPGLAEDMCASPRTVTTAIAALEKAGVIQVERHPRRNTRYLLLRPTSLVPSPVDNVLEESSPAVHTVADAAGLGSRICDPGSQQVQGWVAGGATDPVVTPQSNKQRTRARRPEPAARLDAARQDAPPPRCDVGGHEHSPWNSAVGCVACKTERRATVTA